MCISISKETFQTATGRLNNSAIVLYLACKELGIGDHQKVDVRRAAGLSYTSFYRERQALVDAKFIDIELYGSTHFLTIRSIYCDRRKSIKIESDLFRKAVRELNTGAIVMFLAYKLLGVGKHQKKDIRQLVNMSKPACRDNSELLIKRGWIRLASNWRGSPRGDLTIQWVRDSVDEVAP